MKDNRSRTFKPWAPEALLLFFSSLESRQWDIGARTDSPAPWRVTAHYSPKNKARALNASWRWGNDQEMEVAWELLRDSTGKSFSDATWFACQQTIGYMGMFEADPRLSAKERQDHFTEIAKRAKVLARNMRATLEYHELGPADFFWADELELISRSICNVAFGNGTDFDAAAKRERETFNEQSVRFALTPVLPSVPALIDRFAIHAASEAKRRVRQTKTKDKSEKRPLEAVYVAAKISADLFERSSVALDAFSARLVNSACGTTNLTPDNVRKARLREIAGRRASRK